ncbi:MAG: hypothetical protein QOF76_2287 [Solirubrobacteraceae bacterium]|nr:hypothetical protein [Solirubrobacteraceae bacterium]
MALPDRVRAACAEVAGRAGHVRIVESAIAGYAGTLPEHRPGAPAADPAFALQLGAINFGSGWFPTLRKRPGLSGFRTVEAGLRERGAWSRDELVALDARAVAATFGQDPGHPLMALFARALNELGERDPALTGDAVTIAERLAALPTWHDASAYGDLTVPFFKRAQIAAADLAPATAAALTMFADNLVPHVLRLDGVLEFDAALVDRIDREDLLEHGSPEEVEIRACAVHAVELLVAAHGATTAAGADWALWTRGGEPRYKARPRHRARCTAY